MWQLAAKAAAKLAAVVLVVCCATPAWHVLRGSDGTLLRERGLFYDCVYDEAIDDWWTPVRGCVLGRWSMEEHDRWSTTSAAESDVQVLILLLFAVGCMLLLAWKKQSDSTSALHAFGYASMSFMAFAVGALATALFLSTCVDGADLRPLRSVVGYSFWLLLAADALLFGHLVLQLLGTCSTRALLSDRSKQVDF